MKRILLLSLAISAGSAASAQTLTPGAQTLTRVISASPDAAAIATYQTYPVDHISGAPAIEIPLFDVPTKAGVLPFKLSYHPGSLKPSGGNGIVGWGWTLSPNLGVARSVKGAIDGVNTGFHKNSQLGTTTMTYWEAAAANILDEQPDDFFYSLLSKSGRFIYNRSGNFVTLPREPIKIVHPNDNLFEITDDDGTMYKFGRYSTGAASATEFSSAANYVLTGWRITEIIPYDKSDTIQFYYHERRNDILPYYDIKWKTIDYPDIQLPDVQYPGHVYRSSYYTSAAIFQARKPTNAVTDYPANWANDYDFAPPYVDGHTLFMDGIDGPSSPKQVTAWAAGGGYGADYASDEVFSENVTEYRPLSHITFKGGVVLLDYNGKQLQSIILASGRPGNYSTVKQATLYQRQLNHGDDQPLPYYNNFFRFGLDSIDVNGLMYRMEYSKSGTQESVGIYGGYSSDFWGYYNGRREWLTPRLVQDMKKYTWSTALENQDDANGQGGTLVSGVSLVVGEKQELADNYPMIPGVIKSLRYPTGGLAEFTWENNMYYSSYAYKPVFGGGIRIKQIKYATGDGRDSVMKRYKYGQFEDGVGRTRYQNYDANFKSEQIKIIPYTSGGISYDFQTVETTINSKPTLDMTFANGAGVLYNEVAEYTISLPDSISLGKTIYSYTIDSRNQVWLYNTPLQADDRTDWRQIWLRNVANYRYKNGTYDLVSRTAYEYRDFYTDTIPAGQTYQKYRYAAGAGNLPAMYNYQAYTTDPLPHIDYKIYSGVQRQTAILDTLFNPDDPTEYVAKKTSIVYEPVNFYKSYDSTTSSKNEVLKTRYYYPFQAGSLSNLPTAQATLMGELQSINRINQPVEVRRYRQDVMMETVQQHYSNSAGTRIYPSSVYTSTRSNPLEKRLEITRYDNIGNVLEQNRTDDVKEVYIWGYNSLYPVAKIIGSNFSTAQALINQSMLNDAAYYTDAQIRTELNKIRTGLAGTIAQVVTYTYKPMVGITSETDPNGVTTYYEYDSKGRLALIKNQHGHIVKMFCYNYAGQPQDCLGGL